MYNLQALSDITRDNTLMEHMHIILTHILFYTIDDNYCLQILKYDSKHDDGSTFHESVRVRYQMDVCGGCINLRKWIFDPKIEQVFCSIVKNRLHTQCNNAVSSFPRKFL